MMDKTMRMVKARAMFLLREWSSPLSPFLIMKNSAEPRLATMPNSAKMIQNFIVGIML